MSLYLGCIDPGYKHLGIRFERRVVTEEGDVIIDESKNITTEIDTSSVNLFNTLLNVINQYNDYFQQCDYIFIERQPNKKISLCKIEFGFQCILKMKYTSCNVELVNNKDKYIYNGINTTHKTRREKKQILGPEYSLKICEKYSDFNSIDDMNIVDKKDEIADTILMIEAYLIKNKIQQFYTSNNLLPVFKLMTVIELKKYMKECGLVVGRKKKIELIEELETYFDL